MKQGDSEEAADFLVKVTNAVNGLAKDWKGHLTEEELTPSSTRYSSMGSRRRSAMCLMLRRSSTLI